MLRIRLVKSNIPWETKEYFLEGTGEVFLYHLGQGAQLGTLSNLLQLQQSTFERLHIYSILEHLVPSSTVTSHSFKHSMSPGRKNGTFECGQVVETS